MTETTLPSEPSSDAARSQTEAALLLLLLEQHPSPLAHDEIMLLMISGPPGSAMEQDDVRLAIRTLIGAGLARRDNQLVRLTYAAVQASTLLDI